MKRTVPFFTQFQGHLQLTDQRLRDRFEHKTVTGWGWCPKCEEKKNEGFVALVVVCNPVPRTTDTLRQEDAIRSGELIWIRETAWDKVFNAPAPAGKMAFIDEEAARKLEELVASAEGGQKSNAVDDPASDQPDGMRG